MLSVCVNVLQMEWMGTVEWRRQWQKEAGHQGCHPVEEGGRQHVDDSQAVTVWISALYDLHSKFCAVCADPFRKAAKYVHKQLFSYFMRTMELQLHGRLGLTNHRPSVRHFKLQPTKPPVTQI